MNYAVSVLLANIWTCLRGNQTSVRFRCAPPEVEDYLRLSNGNLAVGDDGLIDNQQARAEGIIIEP